MLVRIFGVTLLPRICGYVSRQRSADNNGFLSESIDAVARNFYGDDLLKYFETTVQTIEIRRASYNSITLQMLLKGMHMKQ